MTREELLELYALGRRRFNELNLGGINLSGEYLKGVEFTETNLSGANLSNTNLSNADFKSADLSNANLKGANLQRAYLRFAKLSRAVLPEELGAGVVAKACRDKAWLIDTGYGARSLTRVFCRVNETVWWAGSGNMVEWSIIERDLHLATSREIMELTE